MIEAANEAIRDYESNKKEEELGNAYYWRGAAQQEMGQLQEAVEDLKKAVRHYSGRTGMARLRLAYAYLRLGNVRAARREYQASRIEDEDFIRELESKTKQTR